MTTTRRSVLRTAAGVGGLTLAAAAAAAGTASAATGSGVAWLNVRDFGALGHGVADDSVSINAAVSAASSAGGGTAGTHHLGPRIEGCPLPRLSRRGLS